MAAVAPPPNVHLTALANHFTQAAAEATALAANPPAHLNPLAHIAGQLQLILNSINALDQRMNDLDHKLHINFQLLEQHSFARAANSTCALLTTHLVALDQPIPAVGPVLGPHPNFPATLNDLNRLSGNDSTALLQAYNIPLPIPNNATTRRSAFARYIGKPLD